MTPGWRHHMAWSWRHSPPGREGLSHCRGRQLQTSYIFLQTSLFGFGTCKQVFFWCRQVIIFDIENNLFTHQKRLAYTKKNRVSKFKKKTCLHQNGVGRQKNITCHPIKYNLLTHKIRLQTSLLICVYKLFFIRVERH